MARLRATDGQVLRYAIESAVAATAAAPYQARATPPPIDLFARPEPSRRGRGDWTEGAFWLLRSLRESYQRYF